MLINAYDFLRPKYQPILENGWCHQTHLDFGNKPILVDSGAYYFLKHNKVGVTPQQILDVEIRSRADVGVVLDHPFLPGAADRRQRQKTTLENTRVMLDDLASRDNVAMQLMPAVHGHTPGQIRHYMRHLRHMMEPHGGVERVGIGSVAPLAKHGNGKMAAEVIHAVRRELPESHVHCFSMGSALLMLLAFYCGADTVDSQSWIVSAAFKLAQLPGHYTVRLGRELLDANEFRVAMRPFCDRLRRLAEEEGFSVRDWSTPDGPILDLNTDADCYDYARSLLDERSNERIHHRACHNLWSYNFDVQQAREARSKGELEEFVERRLKDTRYAKAFDYARELRRQSPKRAPGRYSAPTNRRVFSAQAPDHKANCCTESL